MNPQVAKNVGDQTRLGTAISIAFMPPLSSSYAFLALSFSTGVETSLVPLTVSLVFGTLIQLITLFGYSWYSKKDMNVEERRDRPALFTIATLSYLIGFLLLRYLGAPFIFTALMFAYVANTTLATAITRYITKVSIHTWGITGPSIAILYAYGLLAFAVALIVGGVVGSARIRMGYHTRWQVVLSFVASIPLTWLVIYVMPILFPTLFSL